MKKVISRLVHSANPPLCRDVSEWAWSRGLEVREAHPLVPPPHEFPEAFPGGLSFRRAFEDQFSAENLRPQRLIGLAGARIRGVNGILILPDGAFCTEGQVVEKFVTEHPDYTTQMPRPRHDIAGTVYSLVCLWVDSYYHWFHDVLPRLLTALPHLPGDTRYLVPRGLKPFQVESLEALGIHPDRMVEHDPAEDSAPEFLWFATPLATTMHTSVAVLAELRSRIRAHLLRNGPLRGAGRRIFVSRAKTARRRLLNEPEVSERLRQLGVETVCAEELSFAEQVALFSQTALLIAPHGAGLTNMLFMDSGRRALELQDEHDPRFCYWRLSQDMGLNYAAVFGPSNGGPLQDADFSVPLAALEKALEAIPAE
jgi:hypothetical protein